MPTCLGAWRLVDPFILRLGVHDLVSIVCAKKTYNCVNIIKIATYILQLHLMFDNPVCRIYTKFNK